MVLGGAVVSIEQIHRVYIQSMAVTESMIPSHDKNFHPPKNRTINSLSDLDAVVFTRLTKEELHILFTYLCLPLGEINVTRHKHNQYRYFNTEEIFILSLTKLAYGLTWVLMGKTFFGGNPDYFEAAFHWFINHVFVTFLTRLVGNLSCAIGLIKLTTSDVPSIEKLEYHHVKLRE